MSNFYTVATGVTGDPTAPVNRNAGAVSKNRVLLLPFSQRAGDK
jgi:hypothetical protein